RSQRAAPPADGRPGSGARMGEPATDRIQGDPRAEELTMDTRKAFLTGKVAAVTGAGSGIGKGIAKGMADFGAKAAILERDPETSQRTADEIGAAGGQALSLVTDVRDGEAVERAIAATCERFGGIDVLVNNAGGVFAAPFMETGEKGWNALWRANMLHVFHC